MPSQPYVAQSSNSRDRLSRYSTWTRRELYPEDWHDLSLYELVSHCTDPSVSTRLIADLCRTRYQGEEQLEEDHGPQW